jgi:2,3-bisphosphoglycerate-dependent phosphoglycerate mutase
MTNVYFIRHAESDNSVHDDMSRPLTEKGMKDRTLVSDYLENKGVSIVVSSPYKRAYDTVAEFANRKGLEIIRIDAFRERRIADGWIDDFVAYSKQQWSDFDFKLSTGESLGEVQARNVEALKRLLSSCPDETIVIGTHGTSLSTVVNYYDKTFTYDSFLNIAGLMPWIVHFEFDGDKCVSITSINPFA